MKKIVILTLLSVVALPLLAQKKPAAKPITAVRVLKYSDHEPLGGMRTRFIKDVFLSAIEKESDGRLKIEEYWGSELATGYDALRMVGKEGAADMAIVVPEYASNNLPLHQLFKSFPTGPSGGEQVAFFRRAYAEIPAFPAELEKENVVNLFFATGYPVAFLSTRPLSTLENIRDEKWRSASFWHKDFLQNAGATPVTMPWGEGVYKALKDGSLDGLMVNMDSGHDINAHEAAPNVLVSKDLWLGHVYLLVMNKDTWNGLTKEDKEAIQRAAETAYRALGAVMDSSFDAMVKNMRKEDVNIRILEPKEVEHWKTATKYQEVQAAWVKEQEEKGVKDVSIVMEKVNAVLNEIVSSSHK